MTVDTPLDTPVAAASFETFLLPLVRPAYGTALRLTRSAADAEDLVQEASLQAFRGFGSFRPGSNFKAWFYRILTNCFVSRYRARRKEQHDVSLDDAPTVYLGARSVQDHPAAAGDDPAGALLSRVTEQQVVAALGALPEEYRAVATLYFMEDFSYQQIAEVLDVPVGTVRSRLHRGRRLLQAALWDLAREHGIAFTRGED
jgi:RNA polymerase sigma-70 factor (ECF subfamily)